MNANRFFYQFTVLFCALLLHLTKFASKSQLLARVVMPSRTSPTTIICQLHKLGPLGIKDVLSEYAAADSNRNWLVVHA